MENGLPERGLYRGRADVSEARADGSQQGVIYRSVLHGLSIARALRTSRRTLGDRDTTNTGENPNCALRSRKGRPPQSPENKE
jgi:hypothetical protein